MLKPLPPKKLMTKVDKAAVIMSTNSTDQLLALPPSPLDLQVARGKFRVSKLNQHALVISQGWPSWTFGLEGLGFKTISTTASFPSLSSREEFKSTHMGTTLLDKESVSNWAESHTKDGVVFVQGSQKFLDMTHHKLKGFQDMICIFGCSESTFNTNDSWRESHSRA